MNADYLNIRIGWQGFFCMDLSRTYFAVKLFLDPLQWKNDGLWDLFSLLRKSWNIWAQSSRLSQVSSPEFFLFVEQDFQSSECARTAEFLQAGAFTCRTELSFRSIWLSSLYISPKKRRTKSSMTFAVLSLGGFSSKCDHPPHETWKDPQTWSAPVVSESLPVWSVCLSLAVRLLSTLVLFRKPKHAERQGFSHTEA